MTLPPSTARLHRRAVLLGAGGVLLAGCGGQGTTTGTSGRTASASGSPVASPSGPIIQSQDAGNVISAEDLTSIVTRLNAAVQAGDVQALQAAVKGKIATKQWKNRLAVMRQFPLEDLGFVLEDTSGRTVNAAGGLIDTDANVVLTHRITGCDSRVVVQGYRGRLYKKDTASQVELRSLDGPSDDPAPWDLAGTWKVLQAQHVVVAVRQEHLAQARQFLPQIDAGVADAMAILPPAAGIRRMAITIAEPDSPVYGGSSLADRNGFAARMDYIDPETAVREGTAGEKSDIFATSRIVFRPGVFSSAAYVRETALHETIHGLALQWSYSASPWIAEGLARWADSGGAAGFRRDSYQVGLVKRGFNGFAQRFLGLEQSENYALFQKQDATTVNTNYSCSAAVYAAVEEAKGRTGALGLGRACYEHGPVQGPKDAGFGSQKKLFDLAGRWVAAL